MLNLFYETINEINKSLSETQSNYIQKNYINNTDNLKILINSSSFNKGDLTNYKQCLSYTNKTKGIEYKFVLFDAYLNENISMKIDSKIIEKNVNFFSYTFGLCLVNFSTTFKNKTEQLIDIIIKFNNYTNDFFKFQNLTVIVKNSKDIDFRYYLPLVFPLIFTLLCILREPIIFIFVKIYRCCKPQKNIKKMKEFFLKESQLRKINKFHDFFNIFSLSENFSDFFSKQESTSFSNDLGLIFLRGLKGICIISFIIGITYEIMFHFPCKIDENKFYFDFPNNITFPLIKFSLSEAPKILYSISGFLCSYKLLMYLDSEINFMNGSEISKNKSNSISTSNKNNNLKSNQQSTKSAAKSKEDYGSSKNVKNKIDYIKLPGANESSLMSIENPKNEIIGSNPVDLHLPPNYYDRDRDRDGDGDRDRDRDRDKDRDRYEDKQKINGVLKEKESKDDLETLESMMKLVKSNRNEKSQHKIKYSSLFKFFLHQIHKLIIFFMFLLVFFFSMEIYFNKNQTPLLKRFHELYYSKIGIKDLIYHILIFGNFRFEEMFNFFYKCSLCFFPIIYNEITLFVLTVPLLFFIYKFRISIKLFVILIIFLEIMKIILYLILDVDYDYSKHKGHNDINDFFFYKEGHKNTNRFFIFQSYIDVFNKIPLCNWSLYLIGALFGILQYSLQTGIEDFYSGYLGLIVDLLYSLKYLNSTITNIAIIVFIIILLLIVSLSNIYYIIIGNNSIEFIFPSSYTFIDFIYILEGDIFVTLLYLILFSLYLKENKWVISFLSHSAWLMTNKIYYTFTYLSVPLMFWLFYLNEGNIPKNFFSYTYFSVVGFFIIFILGTLITVFIEIPLKRLIKLIIKQSQSNEESEELINARTQSHITNSTINKTDNNEINENQILSNSFLADNLEENINIDNLI